MQKKLLSLYTSWRRARQQKQHRLAQGRLTANEAATCLPDSGEMPLARLPVSHGATPTVYATAENRGHLLIAALPGSHWREQLCLTLTHWPGAALVVDPDGWLYRQTAAFRQAQYGPVYAHPGYRLWANNLLRIWLPEAAFQLHRFLMPPSTQAAAAEDDNVARTVSLICAVGFYSLTHKRNPFQLLLDMALTDMLTALAALETVPQARLHVRHFTKGQPPQLAIYDAATVQAFTWFSQQLWRYQEAYTTFAMPEDQKEMIPDHWSRVAGTVYLTYPTPKLAEMAGLVTAMVSSQLVAHQTYGLGKPLLLVLDTSLASRLPHFAQFLATAADYGITVVLTAPSLSALDALNPIGSGETLAAQFPHQLWYAPRDRETAVHIATRYGTHLDASGASVATLTAEEVLGWSDETLLLVTERQRPYLVIGQPVKLPEDFRQRQPPRPPATEAMPRRSDQWLPDLPDLTRQMAEVLVASGAIPIPVDAAEGKNESEDTAVAKEQTASEPIVESAGDVATAPDPSTPNEQEFVEEAKDASEESLNVARARYR